MGAIDEIEARHNGDLLGAAKEIGRGLICGTPEIRGYSPKTATFLALHVTGSPKTVDEILKERESLELSNFTEIYSHLLGFHDGLLKDRRPGYKVPDGGGADYEEGHRLAAELDREQLNFRTREIQ